MSGVSDLALLFPRQFEGFDGSTLDIQFTSDYSSSCPDSAMWTSAQVISDAGSYSVDLSAAIGTDVFVGVQYLDSDGTYSSWSLSNVGLVAFGSCPTLGTRPVSDCVHMCGVTLQTENYVCGTNTAGAGNDTVTIEIPYTGLEDTLTSVTTTSTGTVGGDDPITIADGTITITGLSEGDAWDLTLNGGDCDGTIDAELFLLTINRSSISCYINEIHSDPSNAAGEVGDANGDGTAVFNEDEFVEIYNISQYICN